MKGDDLNCHAAEQFNNSFIIIFHKSPRRNIQARKVLWVFVPFVRRSAKVTFNLTYFRRGGIIIFQRGLLLIAGRTKGCAAIHPDDGLL